MFCSCWSVGALGSILRLALPKGLQAALCVQPCVSPGLGLLVFAPLSSFSTGAAVPESRYWYLSAGSNPGWCLSTGSNPGWCLSAGSNPGWYLSAGSNPGWCLSAGSNPGWYLSAGSNPGTDTCQLAQIQAGTGAAAEAVRPALHVTAQGSQARSPGPPEAFSYTSEIFFSNSVIFCRDLDENH